MVGPATSMALVGDSAYRTDLLISSGGRRIPFPLHGWQIVKPLRLGHAPLPPHMRHSCSSAVRYRALSSLVFHCSAVSCNIALLPIFSQHLAAHRIFQVSAHTILFWDNMKSEWLSKAAMYLMSRRGVPLSTAWQNRRIPTRVHAAAAHTAGLAISSELRFGASNACALDYCYLMRKSSCFFLNPLWRATATCP